MTKPKLALVVEKAIADVKFCLKEFMQYDEEAIRSALKAYPGLFLKNYKLLQTNFNYFVQVMKLEPSQILTYPPMLQVPLITIKSRYAFLKHLKRDQFDPTKPNFVSFNNLLIPNDNEFCEKFAKTTITEYRKFLKTL